MTDIITRIEAKEKGLKRYFNGRTCKRGHIAERFVGNSGCIVCHQTKGKEWLQNNKEAKAKTQKNYYERNKEKLRLKQQEYFRANPSKKAEINRRYKEQNPDKVRASTRQFYLKNKDKKKIYEAAYKKAHPEKSKERSKRWRENNAEKAKIQKDIWNANNKDRIKRVVAEWVKNNREKARSYVRFYQASKLKATPLWADRKAIELIYASCPSDCHVDHIVPLRSKLVCGLHVESNLQILPIAENIKKSNKQWPDMP